jgi:mycothiol synthase
MLTWRSLCTADRPSLSALAQACLDADGGLPFLADGGFLDMLYPADAVTLAATSPDGTLVAAAAVRAGVAPSGIGMIHPRVRGRGAGAHLLDWQLAQAPGLTVRSESLTPAAQALFASRGLSCIFGEHIMRFDGIPPTIAVPGVRFEEWSAATSARFFTVYDASFRERPGFPGYSEQEWIADTDEETVPARSLLAVLDGVDAGFITCDPGGWVNQVGVLPAYRGRAVAAVLLAEAGRRYRAAGGDHEGLAVNHNNPTAYARYLRYGFVPAGERARFTAAG